MKEIPDEVRQEYVRLSEMLKAAIQRRDEIKRRKEAVSPKIWQMAMRSIKPELRPNLRVANFAITNIRRQMLELISKYEEPINLQSEVAGDPLHLKMPIARSKIYGYGIRLGSEDEETDS
jgi:hypothetical protein